LPPSNTVFASDFDGLQEAVDAVPEGGTVAVDTDFTLEETVDLRSDISLEGLGGTISAGPETNVDLLGTDDVSNVHINGLTVDGNRSSNDGNRLIGGVNVGGVSNLRVTDCRLRNAALNAVELVATSEDELDDIYIANNTISGSANHGVILGVKEAAGTLHDVIIENNTITDTVEAQAIGVFGQDPGEEYNTAILGNTVDNTDNTSRNGTNIAFEEDAHDNIAYGNQVVCNPSANRSGIGATKNARHCIIGNNLVRDTRRAYYIANWEYYEPEGPPRFNVVTQNVARNSVSGFYHRALEGDLAVTINRFLDCGNIIEEEESNGSGYRISLNGPGVSADGIGLPDDIGDSVSYRAASDDTAPPGSNDISHSVSYSDSTTAVYDHQHSNGLRDSVSDVDTQGDLIAEATWDRGSPDPDDPVSVSVETNF